METLDYFRSERFTNPDKVDKLLKQVHDAVMEVSAINQKINRLSKFI
jgi:hypothetical protein